MPRRTPSKLLAAALVIAASAPAAYSVPIGVRAKTRVEIEHRKGPSGVILVGRLLDDASLPIPDERVILELPGLSTVTRLTDQRGSFERALSPRELARLRQDGDLVTWTARFDGNSRLGKTSEEGTLDLSKRSTRLEVRVASASPGDTARVILGDRPIEVAVALSDVSTPSPRPLAQSAVSLEIGSGRQLVGATGSSGAATFVVPPTSLVGGGRYRVVARFAGDALFAASRAEAELIVLKRTRVTLRVVREGDEQRGRYRMSGRVSDEDWPLDEQVVAIDGIHPEGVAFELVAATDEDGVFVAALPAAELAVIRDRLGGDMDRLRLEIKAFYRPADRLHAPSESAGVMLDVPLPVGIPLRWYLGGLGLAIAFIAIAHAIRSGALRRRWTALVAGFLGWWRRLGRRAPPAPEAPEDELQFVTPRRERQADHPRIHDRISGILVDAHTRSPLVGRIEARSEDRHQSATTDRRGAFALGPLTPGAWTITVDAPGYLPRELVLELPHGGDYDGAYWALVAVHRAVREVYARTLAGLDTELAWGYATPREAMREALAKLLDQSGRATVEPPLGELNHIVERTHFAARSGTGHDVERARALQDAVGQRQTGDPS